MSRSNPTNNTPNPAVKFFEWGGSDGEIHFYEKTERKNMAVGTKFGFILLDELATVKGWHDASESGIYSNEVKDTRGEPMLVKAFKGGVIAEGFYSQIKDRIKAAGGHFTANLYIAFKDEKGLAIGSLQFKGAALNAWVEFKNAHRKEVYEKAIAITGFTEGKKGKVVFKVPNFELKDITEDSNRQALALDCQLQAYLKEYFRRTKVDQVAGSDNLPSEDEPPLDQRQEPEEEDLNKVFPPDDSDIPF